MARKITYEWCVEETDRFGDIGEIYFAQSAEECREIICRLKEYRVDNGTWYMIVLVREEWSGNQITRRDHAYMNGRDGTMPETFGDGGPPVPQKFR